MIAVLKVGSTQELVLIDKNKVYFAFSLNRSTILNDTYKYLKSITEGVDELRVIMTPTIIGSDLECDGVQLNQFDCGGMSKTAYLSKSDLNKLKLLALKLGLREFKLYNMFDFLKLIGKRRPVIVSGKYLDRNMYTVYVDRTGIKVFRESEKPDYHDIVDVQKFSETTTCISELNTELAASVRSEYVNINDMNDDEIKKLYMLLLSHHVTPAKIIKTDSEIENMTQPIMEFDGTVPEEPVTEPIVKDKKANRKKKQKEKTVNENVAPKYPEHAKLNYALEGLIAALAIMVGVNVFSNVQLQAENTAIHDKLDQLNGVLKPMKDNLSYYENYVKVLQSGGSNDLKFIEQLNNIKIDGVLGEVVFNKSNVGVQVYLAKGDSDDATKAAIENYKQSLSKFMNITDVKEDTSANISGATLVKIIIQGTLK